LIRKSEVGGPRGQAAGGGFLLAAATGDASVTFAEKDADAGGADSGFAQDASEVADAGLCDTTYATSSEVERCRQPVQLNIRRAECGLAVVRVAPERVGRPRSLSSNYIGVR
jgi:hypothetical protein